MKITFISQYFFPEQFSNTEIVRYLQDNCDHEVHVITGVPNYPAGVFFPGYSNQLKRDENWNGVIISRCWTKPRGKRGVTLLLNYLVFPITGSWTLLRRIKEKPDVSLVSMPSPLLQALVGVILKWRYKTPLVYWVQDIWPESALYTLNLKNPLIVKPLTWLCGWIYRRADLILVQSAAFPPMIERFGINSNNIRVLPNTAPNTYIPIEPNPDNEIGLMMPKSGFNLMFAGNIGESQDFDTYLATAELLRHRADLNWVIIGSGRDLPRVQDEVVKRGLKDVFYFLGRHPECSMPEFFAHADAMLVGLKDNAIFRLTVPYKVQCYMACGRPIIASLNGEGARIIEHSQSGLVAQAQSPEQLCEVIERMLATPSIKRDEYGKNARKFFDVHYRLDKVYSDLENWLHEISQKH